MKEKNILTGVSASNHSSMMDAFGTSASSGEEVVFQGIPVGVRAPTLLHPIPQDRNTEMCNYELDYPAPDDYSVQISDDMA